VCPTCPWPNRSPSTHVPILIWYDRCLDSNNQQNIHLFPTCTSPCHFQIHMYFCLSFPNTRRPRYVFRPSVPWSKPLCLFFTVYGPLAQTPRLTFAIAVDRHDTFNTYTSWAKRQVTLSPLRFRLVITKNKSTTRTNHPWSQWHIWTLSSHMLQLILAVLIPTSPTCTCFDRAFTLFLCSFSGKRFLKRLYQTGPSHVWIYRS